jgi:hypothetical protein
MDRFFSKIVMIMEKLVRIAPHLREILSTILKKSNNSSISETQLSILKPDLIQFEIKLGKLLGLFKINEENQRFFGPEYDNDSVHAGAVYWMKMIAKIHEKIKEDYISKVVECTFLSEPMSSCETRISNIIELVEPHFMISNILGDSGVGLTPISARKKQVVMILRDGILALSRIQPERKVAISGTLHIQNVQSPTLIAIPKFQETAVKRTFPYYNLVRISDFGNFSDSSYLYKLETKKTYFDDEVSQAIFGKEANSVTMFDLYKKRNSDFIFTDNNFGRKALWSKVLGSSLSSLDMSLELLSLIGEYLFRKNGLRVHFRHVFRERGINDVMDFCDFENMCTNSKNIHINELTLISNEVLNMMEITIMGIEKFNMFNDFIDVLF